MEQIKHLLLLLFLSLATVSLTTSCGKDIDWESSIEKEMDFWLPCNLCLYYVDSENKNLLDINDPTTWPIISEKQLSQSEVDALKQNMETVASGVGFKYNDGHMFIGVDSYADMPFITPQLKCSNTGKRRHYIYRRGKEDVVDVVYRFTKEKGNWYGEVHKVYYNEVLAYESGKGSTHNLVIKETK